MVRTMRLVLLAAAAAIASGGCDGSQAECSLSASGITCKGETFDACAVAGCPIGDFNCAIPRSGCQIAPGMVLAHYQEKPPGNDAYLCGYPLSICGLWTEASCQVTVTNYLGGAPDAGVSISYAIHDSTCP
jgi:hypothetical protein